MSQARSYRSVARASSFATPAPNADVAARRRQRSAEPASHSLSHCERSLHVPSVTPIETTLDAGEGACDEPGASPGDACDPLQAASAAANTSDDPLEQTTARNATLRGLTWPRDPQGA